MMTLPVRRSPVAGAVRPCPGAALSLWEVQPGALPPIGGITWSKSFILVLFQIFLIIALSSSLACSKLPVRKVSRTEQFIPRDLNRSEDKACEPLANLLEGVTAPLSPQPTK